MSLATVDASGHPHVRVVLCKEWSNDGFVFYTNYQSQKGKDLLENKNAACVFFWDQLARQVKIWGQVKKNSRQDSENYWNTRPRESQLSQYISKQSQKIKSRQELEQAWAEADKKFFNQVIPCPENWGGYLIEPNHIEFWIGRAGRLHDRFSFEKSGTNWTLSLLSP